MKGQKEILDMMGELLTAELTAHNLYFVQWQMQENWGYRNSLPMRRKTPIWSCITQKRLFSVFYTLMAVQA